MQYNMDTISYKKMYVRMHMYIYICTEFIVIMMTHNMI